MSSGPGEGQWAQVLPVCVGRQLHASEYLLTVSDRDGCVSLPIRKISEVCSRFQAEHRTMAVFILAVIVNSYNTGQVRECAAFSLLA